MNILMVCLGNICRSPLAEGIMQQIIDKNDLPWTVDSAGTGAWHVGEQPDPRSIETARFHGLDITRQRARKFTPQDFARFDLILAMDAQNYNDICRQAPQPSDQDKVHMVLNFADPDSNKSVPDPYYGGDDGFEKVYQMLVGACEGVVGQYV